MYTTPTAPPNYGTYALDLLARMAGIAPAAPPPLPRTPGPSLLAFALKLPAPGEGAVHEAGHAAVAAALGVRFTHAEVKADGSGALHCSPDRTAPPTPAALHADAVVSAAGAVAVALFARPDATPADLTGLLSDEDARTVELCRQAFTELAPDAEWKCPFLAAAELLEGPAGPVACAAARLLAATGRVSESQVLQLTREAAG